MSKTDMEIFGEDEEPIREKTKGRPKVNEDLARRLFEADKYTTGQIAKKLQCHPETVRRIRRKLEKEGLIEVEKNVRTPSFVEADFEQETINAKGSSFLAWLTTKRKEPRRVFNFCRRVWVMWGKPSLVRVMDPTDQLGDQLCIKFLEIFNDPDKSRDRKKNIRPLFKFLGRSDLNDMHMTMTQARDPRNVEKIPEINDPGFPLKFIACLEELEKLEYYWGVAVKFKLCTQMRTGKKKEERGLFGIKIGTQAKSYVYFGSPENYQIHVLEKMREEWDVGWLPSEVREEIYELYKTKKTGDPLFDFTPDKLLKAWGDITERIIGRRLKLHHLRKISLTWFYVCGLRLEIASRLNVGWRDLSTADRHYMDIGAMLKHSFREEYVKNIPAWFKDGLEDYIAMNPEKIAALLHVR